MPDIVMSNLEEQPTVVVHSTIPVDVIPSFLSHAYHTTAAHIAQLGGEISGPPFARYTPVGDDYRAFEIEAGFPVADAIDGAGIVEASTLPGGSAATATHIGPYESMRPTYESIGAWLRSHRMVPTEEPWEVYLSDPSAEPDPATWRTEIVQPFRAA